ncbi:Hypodermin-A [Papilio xuthus]|uniref:Hypodermin-A n=1 Tax=Papilio xuthus TaxID=66420 RepID=A0A194Q578_PAPXU|nr:Hypodermin-A [Papilio xuthus]
MRILFVVLLCYKQTNSQANDEYIKNMARAFPVQKIIPFHRNIQILNAQKFIRALPDDNALITKKYGAPETYTVFPAIPTKSHKVTYFPIETLFGPNRIIRKVPHQRLLNYSRFKRSALNETKLKSRRHRNREDKYVPNISRIDKINQKNRLAKVRSISVTSRTPKIRENKKEKVNLKSASKSHKVQKSTKRHDHKVRKNKRNHLSKSRSRKNRKENNRRSERNQRVNASRRLLAGKDSTIEQYPYMVSIQKGDEHWCSGALLNPRLVITTANCVWKSVQVSRMKIRAGSKYSDRGGQVARIQELMRHPGWSIRHNPDYDVALLLLDRNLRFSHSLHSVDLPNRSMMPAFNDAWVTSWGSDKTKPSLVKTGPQLGWGTVRRAFRAPDRKRDGVYQNTGLTLQAYNAKIMDFGKCQNITQRFGVFVTRNFFCMSQIGRRSPCTRDTGAPAVSDGVLWGLASWGLRKLCGTERFPAMFTYVASTPIMNFLENTTRQLMSDDRNYPYPDRIADTLGKAPIISSRTFTYIRCGTERFPAMFTYVASTPIMNFLENTTRQLMSDDRNYPYPDRIADTWIKELMVNMSMTKAG